MFELDAMSIEVLKLADGQRRREDMIDVMAGWFQAGRLALDRDGTPVTSVPAARDLLEDRLDAALAMLRRSALLLD